MILEKIDQDLLALAKQSDNDLKDIYAQVDELCLVNSNKVLSAFIENQVSYSDFTDINGYGNYDEGRDKLESRQSPRTPRSGTSWRRKAGYLRTRRISIQLTI